MTEAPRRSPAPTTQVWHRPWFLGYAEILRGLGGIVAPLLAGFSLAAIAAILTGDTMPPLGEEAILAFAVTVALLLFAMQIAFLGLAYNPHPNEHLAWYPEATQDEDALAYARARQQEDLQEMTRYWRLAGHAYDMGLIAFLAGVLLLLVPSFWSLTRGVAFGITAAALLLEVWWILTPWKQVPHPVVRWPQNLPAEDVSTLDDVSRQAVLTRNGDSQGDEQRKQVPRNARQPSSVGERVADG